MTISRKSIFLELFLATTFVLAVGRILYVFRANHVVGPYVAPIVAILFLYTPVAVLWKRKRPVDFLDRNVSDFLRSIRIFAVWAIIIFPLFLLGTHFWQIYLMGYKEFHAAAFPNLFNETLVQLVLIALPEEFFFRGYFQSAVDLIFKKRWRILKADLGWGWIITAGVFAFGHSVVNFEWWHFSIFFPALLFGYLRERTGSIIAPVLFHAASNLISAWIVSCYFK